MGKSLKKIAKVAFMPVTATTALVSGTKKVAGLTKGTKASSSDAANLRKEKEDESKKRVRLYSTGNGELGEEVESVLSSEKRGKLFRNE